MVPHCCGRKGPKVNPKHCDWLQIAHFEGSRFCPFRNTSEEAYKSRESVNTSQILDQRRSQDPRSAACNIGHVQIVYVIKLLHDYQTLKSRKLA